MSKLICKKCCEGQVVFVEPGNTDSDFMCPVCLKIYSGVQGYIEYDRNDDLRNAAKELIDNATYAGCFEALVRQKDIDKLEKLL